MTGHTQVPGVKKGESLFRAGVRILASVKEIKFTSSSLLTYVYRNYII